MSNQDGSQRVKKSGNKMATYSKSDERYWLSRVEFWKRKVAGNTVTDKTYSIRLSHAKKREIFQLHTANKKDAAQKARDIFLSLKANGWDATLDEYKPKVAEKTDSPTIGDVIRVYSEYSEVPTKTAGNYARVFRTVVADIMGISGDNSRYDYVNGGNEKWKAKVDMVLLSDITQDEVQKWKISYVKARATNPLKEKSARNSANSYIRYCRSIFAVDLLPYMSKRLALPDKLPFHQVKLYKKQSMKYESKFNVEELLMKAQDELIGIEQDQQWMILVIAVCSGLRRGEIDKLTWNQVLFDHKKIFLGTTEVFDPKTDSGVSVPMDDDLITLLRRHKEKHGGEYVIQSDVKPLFNTSTPHYRADRHEKALIKWLRKNGNDAYKPIQTLRKEAGSLVTERYGLHAASLFLRHADIQVTSDHYVDSSKPSSTGLSALLTGKDAE